MSVVISGTREVPIEEVMERGRRAAQGYLDLGLKAGDTIALVLRNDIAFIEASLAAGFIAAYPVPVNWHATPDEAHYIFENSGAAAVIIHADLLTKLESALPKGVPVRVVPTPPEIGQAYGIAPSACAVPQGYVSWPQWLESFAPLPPSNILPPASIIYTSGTTGNPKGVRRFPPTQVQFDAFGKRMGRVFFDSKPGSEIIAVTPGPMYHSAPNNFSMMAVRRGAKLIIQPRYDAEDLLQLIEKFRITHLHMVPTMFVRLLKLPEEIKRKYDFSSLQYVVHGAAPCPPEVKRAMIAWWGPIIYEYYGSTETSAVSFCNSQEWLAHPGTVGALIEGCTARIIGDDGKEVAQGEPGDVYVRLENGPVFTYHGDDEKRRSIERDGLITAGDIGYFDKDGFLYLSDRKKDLIISGGVNIYPAEIEAALIGMKGVHDCAVFGIPDEEFGESICVFIELEKDARLTEQNVRDYLRSKIAGYKVPKTIEFRSGLPREDSGKIFKRKLRAPFWEKAGRQI